jgi:hypothetical protein
MAQLFKLLLSLLIAVVTMAVIVRKKEPECPA